MRRRFTSPLVVVGALLALAGSGCGADRSTEFQSFHSRPDLHPPVIHVTTPARGTSPGYVFIAPKHDVLQAGPMIVDNSGQVVWFRALDTMAVADFRVQTYQGKPVLTYWRGQAIGGMGNGYDVIRDSSYDEIAQVRAGNDLSADIHEFLITPQDTALITVYHRVPMDLSSVGGPATGSSVLEGVVQEIDIATGEVLFEWHSADHVGIDESYSNPPPASQKQSAPFDYFHINAIDVEPDGNLLVSARNTHAVYEIDRTTGEVIWRLGGKRSDFTMGPGTSFGWQHHARRQPDGTISIFDNEANPPLAKHSRVIVLNVDTDAHTATLVRAYTHPDGLLSGSQGDGQFLPDGHLFVGWGANPYVTEYDAGGNVIFDAHFVEHADTYRAYRFEWQGTPDVRPALAVETDRRGRVTAYASWNGATDVAAWKVLAGPDPAHLRELETVPKDGFETTIRLGWLTDRRVEVRALDADGNELARSFAKRRPQR